MNGTNVRLDTKLIERLRIYTKKNGQTLAGYINGLLEWSLDYDEAEERVIAKEKKKKTLLKQQ